MKSSGLLLLLSSSQVAAKLGESRVQKQGNAVQRELMALQYYGSNPTVKLGRCEGDCDVDTDCQSSDLTCFQRTKPFTEVPGCSGGASDSSLSDYCTRKVDLNGGTSSVQQNESTVVVEAAQSGAVAIQWSTNFPLGLCQGDCDTDFDCQGGLVCFQRNAKQAVPGCLGGEHDWSLTDYCVPKVVPNPPPPAPVSNPPPPTPQSIPAPVDLNEAKQAAGGDTSFVSGSRTAKFIGDADFHAYPLGECQGDCDNNMDCLPGLFCWQRDVGEPMPYCLGAAGGIDYCIPESESPGKKLKLYWDHYFWQETYIETWWCMDCAECDATPVTTGDGIEGNCKKPSNGVCEEGDLIWIQRCKDVRTRFEIEQNPGSGDQIRLYDTNLCVASREDTGKFMELRQCDNSRQNQLWTPIIDSTKFELRPWSQRGLSSKQASCVSQLHHPKAEEVISLRECWLNIIYETNYWTEWY